jgi:hypothetical protein
VDQGGSLERVSEALASQVTRSLPVQLVIDQRQQLFQRRAIAIAPLA